MRRTIPILVILSLLGAACAGSDSEAAPDTAVEDSVDDVVDSSAVADEAVTDDIIESAPVPTSPDKPTDIAFPGEAPTKLEVNVLTEGEGPESELGDTVIVDYVGVRSLDGEEFDNSYDRGTTPSPLAHSATHRSSPGGTTDSSACKPAHNSNSTSPASWPTARQRGVRSSVRTNH